MWIVKIALDRPYTFIVLALLILVRPTILIEKEIEQKEFPTLTSKLGS